MTKDEINNFLSSSIHTIWFYKERSSCCISFLLALIQRTVLRINSHLDLFSSCTILYDKSLVCISKYDRVIFVILKKEESLKEIGQKLVRNHSP